LRVPLCSGVRVVLHDAVLQSTVVGVTRWQE
jgi:hypothetical protein